MNNLHFDIGNRLKHHRHEKGLSQRALARLAGVTNGLISQIEQNSISPSIASLKKILDVLSLSLADFFTRDGETAPDHFYDRRQLPNLGRGVWVSVYLVGAGIRHRAMSILHEVYPPGADTQMYTHAGEEEAWSPRGSKSRWRAASACSARRRLLFRKPLPHRFRNTGTKPAKSSAPTRPHLLEEPADPRS